jgi:hypothetical protein
MGILNPEFSRGLKRWTIMKRKLDGAGAGTHLGHADGAAHHVGMLSPAAEPVPEIRWTRTAHEIASAARRDRIAIAAYHLSAARGFEPGHDEEDWLNAQRAIDELDAGV